jgi:sugar phosphate isomerase/epimerase
VETLGYETVQFSPVHTTTDVDLERQLRAAAAAGFTWFGVDIWSIRAHLSSGRDLGSLHDVAASCGLECGQLQSLTVGEREPRNLIAALAAAGRALQPATIQVLIAAEPARALDVFRAASAQLREAAPDTTFALEFVPTMPVNSIAASLEFIRASDIERFGINLDSWHFFHGPDMWSDLEALTADEIAHVQFSDHGPLVFADDLLMEMTTRRVFPGDGHLDLTRFFATVRNIGYNGRAGIEILSDAMLSMTPEDFARQAFQRGSRYWGTASHGLSTASE